MKDHFAYKRHLRARTSTVIVAAMYPDGLDHQHTRTLEVEPMRATSQRIFNNKCDLGGGGAQGHSVLSVFGWEDFTESIKKNLCAWSSCCM